MSDNSLQSYAVTFLMLAIVLVVVALTAYQVIMDKQAENQVTLILVGSTITAQSAIIQRLFGAAQQSAGSMKAITELREQIAALKAGE